MNTLIFEKFKIKGANLGNYNCLPDIKNDPYIHAKINLSDTISEEDKKFIGNGMINTLLPYQQQSNYDRARENLEFDGVVLENEFLKAVFISQLGGRLWSLFDKKENKELLYANDVFQPGNLALRNAWFSGGVEWNVGIKGHNPLTCSPMFAQEITDADGSPVLRMYEYERIRGVTYVINAKLKEDVLLVNITIENTENTDKYMYWWSNIAVEETKNTRVIVPAMQSFYCSYEENGYFVNITDLPDMDGKDVTYASNLSQSKDFFYKIPDDEKKWIAAVDENGYGLVQMSTSGLIGRKMFAWGQGKGGRHWNKWLSDSGKNYIEIQAGLLRTQLEHFIMEKNSTISWTEGYTAVSADKNAAHSKNFSVSVNEINSKLKLKQELVETARFEICDIKPLSYYGSGWGKVVSLMNGLNVSNIVEYPEDSLNDETQDWVNLLENGDFPEHLPNEIVKSYVKESKWLEIISKASDTWFKHYQLGVLYYGLQETEKAYEEFKLSNELNVNAWSLRNLSQIEKNENNNLDAACDYIEKAVSVKPDYQPLWVNYAEVFISNKNYKAWIDKFESNDFMFKDSGRLKMLYALCLVKTKRAKEALEVIVNDFEMPDIKEGEFSISHIWLDIYRELDNDYVSTDKEIYDKHPLPERLDFRMH